MAGKLEEKETRIGIELQRDKKNGSYKALKKTKISGPSADEERLHSAVLNGNWFVQASLDLGRSSVHKLFSDKRPINQQP